MGEEEGREDVEPAFLSAPVLTVAERRSQELDRGARVAAARRPVSDWGLRQGMRVTGTATAYEFLLATLGYRTGDISSRITSDVLLLAGADDHYVPLHQLSRQAENLVGARSVTTRVFTADEDAGNHCQIGNLGLAVRFGLAWLDRLR